MLQKLCICEEEDYSEFRDQGNKYDSLGKVKSYWKFRLGAICDETLADDKAVELVEDIFEQIQHAKNLKALKDIISNDPCLSLNKMSEKTYPPITYKLDARELSDLEEGGYLENDGRFVCDLSSKLKGPLEKLLYAIIWKNSDLGKERHIVSGVKAASGQTTDKDAEYPDDGMVFYAFGKYLANRKYPIIDQHVIRAYLLRNAETDDVKKTRKMGTVGKKNKAAIREYEEWLESEDLHKDLKSIEGYRFHIDKVLFALGRAVKTN